VKILIVSQYFWPENFRVNELASEWVKKGYEVTVLTGIPNYPHGKFSKGYGFFQRRKENFAGARIIRVPLMPRGRGCNWELALNYISFVISGCFLGPLHIKGKFDCIFVFGISPITVVLPAILLKILKQAPLFLWVLDLWPQSLEATKAVKSKLLMGLLSKMVKFIYRKCDRVLIASKGFAGALEDMGVREEKIHFFPNWSEDIYVTAKKQHKFELPVLPEGFRVMFSGNVGVAQDFPTIVSAAEILKGYAHIHWIIVGHGRMWEWVKKETESRGLKSIFHLLGSYPAESMPQLFSLADACLVTLRRDPVFALTVPGKIQSYLASGKPIVAALEGSAREMIEDAKAGIVVSPESPNDLAEAVLQMSRVSVETRSKYSESAHAYYRKYLDRKHLFGIMDSWLREWCDLE
jgi:colanic acid biosynthesis glycosyl transferase WcaI